jgi:hypothetical protein
MPVGGGYSVKNIATQALHHAVSNDGKSLFVEASHATPSYCSGATYLVFLKVLADLQATHRITLPPSTLQTLKPCGQPDGVGIWGRWNANGPGTARLFYELGLGSNFTDLSKACPGDFLKIFWSNSLGMGEHGHSVIYLGTANRQGIPTLTFWSSNIPEGFGVKSVPLTRIHRMIFSRLQYPQAVTQAGELPSTDHYLASLQSETSTPDEMARKCGLR